MGKKCVNVAYKLLLSLFAGALALGCGAKKVTTGSFTPVDHIESDLRRGVSTKSDVRRMLGQPDGTGSTVLPNDPRPREIWYYEDIEAADISERWSGPIRVALRHQILLVFFDGDAFDGFMWTLADIRANATVE